MLAARFDSRVRKEATHLVREARAALLHKPELRGKAGDLKTVAGGMEKALDGKDAAATRAQLPVLDALVDELVERKPATGLGAGVESLVTAILLALVLRAFVVEAFKIPSSSMYPTLEIGDHIFVNKFLYGLRIPYTNTKFLELRGPRRGEVIVFMQPCELERDYIKRVVAVAGDTVEVRCHVPYINGQAVDARPVPGACAYQDLDTAGRWVTRECSRYRETVLGETYDTYDESDRPTATPVPDGQWDFPQALDPSNPNTSYELPRCGSPEGGGRPSAAQLPGAIVATGPTTAGCGLHHHYVVPPGHVFVMGDNRVNSKDSRFWGAVPLDHIKGKAMFIWLSYKDSFWKPWTFDWQRIGNFVD